MEVKNTLRFFFAAALLLALRARADTNYIGGVINLTNGQVYSNPIVLTNDTTILSTNGGNITFLSTVDGPYNLSIDTAGTIDFYAPVGENTSLTSLVVGPNTTPRSININHAPIIPVTTTGKQTYNGPLDLAGAVTFTSTEGGNITFMSMQGATASWDLTVSSAGTTTFNDNILNLASLTVGGGGTAVFNIAGLSTPGAQTYNESVLLTQDTTLNSSSNITFGSTVDGAVALSVNAMGNATFSGPIGSAVPLTSLQVLNGEITLGTSITTSGSQAYIQPVVLGGPTALTSLSGSIALYRSVDGPHPLTLNGPGANFFGGQVGGTTPLTSLTVGGGGTLNLVTNLVTTTGSQVYNVNVSLQVVPTTSTITLTSLGGANITFGGTINGYPGNGFVVNTSGNTTFNGVVGGNELYSLITSPAGSVTINTPSITTFTDQTYGNVTLNNSVAFRSTSVGANISFGTIDGAYDLTVYSVHGTNTFNGVVGGVTPLEELVVAGTGTVELNAAAVTTTWFQNYSQNVLLETNVCFTNTTPGGIAFDGTVDGAQNLTAMCPGPIGTIAFNALVGSFIPLSTLTVGGGGKAFLNATITTTGSQAYNENVEVFEPISCVSLGGGSITFANALDGSSMLTLSTAGMAALNGPVGGNTPLAAFTATGGGSLAINGGLVRTTGAQTYNETTALGADTTLSGSPLSLPTLVGNDQALTLSNAQVNALGGLDNGLSQLVVAGGGSVALNATFSVPSVNVTAPATLTGSGIIIAPVTVQPGATLAPSLSSGPFTLLDSLSLSGSTVMELNPGAPTNDLARTFGNIAYGGALMVTNLGGTLVAGDSFRLFEGGSYTGAFTNLDLPLLPAGLIWETRGLTNNGSILVAIQPALTSIAMTGPDDFQLTATGTPNELYNILATTNVALPAPQWWVIGSATADSSGTVNFTDSMATNGSRFYRLGQ